ncbi:HD domain-containing protein [Apibacter sp. B3889]|uniref:HD domain-containing protein n=1 Tax=unclassified Apibacter TaxID=2630820 RepID=UPI00132B4073|nr:MULTISPECIES: HD domain-containing protein [unclassified Apibacter]MXO33862.1 HD domain-containing protein [Apibacter sp. B3883]MXO41219.1 HD domain-containing protein [Apibacter sp. B3889]MXP04626.1 HD domain-containing protein [Apibacter sp. B3887]MXP06801.1 HD domain-containing protein [Apibacter sp. B3935]
MEKINKRKIFNDPVLGFVSISDDLLFDIIEHPYFQRLRRISQTGLSYYVYPGSTHSRFLHALGCINLMQITHKVLKDKGVKISKEEERASLIAILLHDIGHGPFSHALESTLLEGIHHEKLSIIFMKLLNEEFNNELSLAIDIFLNKYPRKFFHQLISSQIDLDRLDYLKRDSFFTGVSEGNVNSERIITMMNVVNDELVIDGKGIYSIEKYLTSRMFMYWQVYFHKTSVTAEIYLIEALKRAKQLVKKGKNVPSSDVLQYFLEKSDFVEINKMDLEKFAQLDDSDVISALKLWQSHEDKTLSLLSQFIIQRKLPSSLIISEPISNEKVEQIKNEVKKLYSVQDAGYFVHQKELSVLAYNDTKDPIKLLLKNGEILELQKADNQVLVKDLRKKITRYHICIPREISGVK